jgi:hypothetical protein
MSQLLSALPVGSLVKETSFTYLGTTPIFRVLEHGHSGDPAGSTTLEFRDVVCCKAYDAREINNPDSGRQSYGNNRYLYSNIHQWLNSSASAGNWYTAKHTYDEPPERLASKVDYNAYKDEAGFLSFFPQNLAAELLTVTKPTTKYTSIDGSGKDNVQCKLFLLSGKEAGVSSIDEGSTYALYETASYRVKKLASTAARGDYTYGSGGDNWGWRLRTPQTSVNYTSSSTNIIDKSGNPSFCPANTGQYGISPAFCVSSNLKVSNSPDTDGAYIITWNSDPEISPASTNYGNVTAPPSITTTITDPDGDTFTYTVKLNGVTKDSGSATGTKTFAVDTTTYWPLMSLGTNTITVQATDSNGATATATYTMNKTNSAAPVPTTDLVNNTRKETSFYIGFQIGQDADGDSQTVVAQVSASSDMSNPTEFTGVEKLVSGAWLPVQTLTNADVGASLRIQVTGQTVGDTIYVRLKDTDSGSGSPVYTSTYAIVIGSVLEFDTLPISRTEKPSLVVAYLNKTMPADATLTMYACNNANDGAPTWEAITEGETHQFTNKTKTAQNWAVSVKTSITAGATAGEISVSAVGLGVL